MKKTYVLVTFEQMTKYPLKGTLDGQLSSKCEKWRAARNSNQPAFAPFEEAEKEIPTRLQCDQIGHFVSLLGYFWGSLVYFISAQSG